MKGEEKKRLCRSISRSNERNKHFGQAGEESAGWRERRVARLDLNLQDPYPYPNPNPNLPSPENAEFAPNLHRYNVEPSRDIWKQHEIYINLFSQLAYF
ncbi:hypothetical protein CEXT_595631 [Caerostris extrusa]|uniref:Uncharacterized protein n=1 Tax=Caerostris extrusa TaxID=172846 RepID=A0AAV4XYX9_CAEEX|nr:hypothetical protein CEXT_595631 [Caerostris extrusa]